MLTPKENEFFETILKMNQNGISPKYMDILSYGKIQDSNNNFKVLKRLEQGGYIKKIDRRYYINEDIPTEHKWRNLIDKYIDDPLVTVLIGVAHQGDNLKDAQNFLKEYYDEKQWVIINLIRQVLTDPSAVPNRPVTHYEGLNELAEQELNQLFPQSQKQDD